MASPIKKDCPACDGFGYTVPVSGGESCPTCGFTTPTDVEQICPLCNGEGDMQTVQIVASGYEWICPGCAHLNREIELVLFVTCAQCGLEFETNGAEHAYG